MPLSTVTLEDGTICHQTYVGNLGPFLTEMGEEITDDLGNPIAGEYVQGMDTSNTLQSGTPPVTTSNLVRLADLTSGVQTSIVLGDGVNEKFRIRWDAVNNKGVFELKVGASWTIVGDWTP